MARVTASLTVSFSQTTGTTSGNSPVLEVDDRADGLNRGNTSFRPGDPVYYLLYVPDGVTIQQHGVTAGSRSAAGEGSRQVEEILTFTDSQEASLQYPASSAVTMEWLGFFRTDGESGAVTRQVIDQKTVRLSAAVAGFLRCRYTANYSAFKLANVPTDLTQALVFVIGEQADG